MPDTTKLTTTRRWRNGMLLAAVLVPSGCSALFERQARRLDALAAHGQTTDAQVTRIDGRGTTFYRYEVDHTPYTWNVAREAAPYAVGEVFRVSYLPETPSFSRPLAVPAEAAAEAVRSRRFARRFAVGVMLFFGLFAALAHRELGRLRLGLDPLDPEVYRARVREGLTVMVALGGGVSVLHGLEARARGESVGVVVVGFVLVLAVLGVTTRFVTRKGPREATGRSAALMRWVLPAAVILALVRAVAAWFAP